MTPNPVEGEALALDRLKEKFEQVTITSILQGGNLIVLFDPKI